MDNQKADNELNLALDSTNEEREKSLDLNVGYNKNDNKWQLIVKYVNNLDSVRDLGIEVVELLSNYAILYVNQEQIDRVISLENIVYVEKPKRLNFTIQQGKRSSCISSLQTGRQDSLNLFGEGTIISVIDSGIDYRHEAFINEDGTTKILEIWDQNTDTYYSEAQINEALRMNKLLVPDTIDVSGHGTAVASICLGVAPESKLIVVKLATPVANSFPRTSELMMAIDYSVRKGLEYNLPTIINLSFGNNYGSHDGASLVETYIDLVSQIGRTTIVAGTGNEATKAIHSSGVIGDEREIVEVAVSQFEPAINIQLWKNYVDEFDIEIISPSGERTGRIVNRPGSSRYELGNTFILIYYGEPSPYSSSQEIYFDFIPKDNYIDSGIWNIVIYPKRIVCGQYNMWLPSNASLNGTAFLMPNPYMTITIPSTSLNIISVGAYNSFNDSYADFSGRGAEEITGLIKPDIVAPGVNIRCASPGGGYVLRSGTSMAAPFVSGAAALLCEWGITKGNDIYLYGEKIKAYLRRGAVQLPGISVSPNPLTGYGRLCVSESLPG